MSTAFLVLSHSLPRSISICCVRRISGKISMILIICSFTHSKPLLCSLILSFVMIKRKRQVIWKAIYMQMMLFLSILILILFLFVKYSPFGSRMDTRIDEKNDENEYLYIPLIYGLLWTVSMCIFEMNMFKNVVPLDLLITGLLLGIASYLITRANTKQKETTGEFAFSIRKIWAWKQSKSSY